MMKRYGKSSPHQVVGVLALRTFRKARCVAGKKELLGVGGLLNLCSQLPELLLQQATTSAAWLSQHPLAGLRKGLADVLLPCL